MYSWTRHSSGLHRSPYGLGDSCSLVRNGEQYFLLLVDKNTEYYVTFNTSTRDTPVTLLQGYMNFTDKPIRFLRVDNAKEFT